MDNRAESGQSARSYDGGQFDQLYRALRRKQELLQKLREQYMLEDLQRPHTWGGPQRQHKSHVLTAPQLLPALPLYQATPILITLSPPPPAPPQPLPLIQQTLPQQPASIIQQLPQQQPMITQIQPPQPFLTPRSIKEDMVELMLMQNAQMHQIIMHNMMLKAMPAMALLPPGGPSHCDPQTTNLGQDSYRSNPIFERPDVKPSGSAVHHHHHCGPSPSAPHLPPIRPPAWLPEGPSVPGGQAAGRPPSTHHDSEL